MWPAAVVADPAGRVRDLWRDRLAQHTGDWYAGLRIQKTPEDLRVYEHLLWESRADAVIELGSHRGGSTLWFRDRLLALARYGRAAAPRVVAVTLDAAAAREGVAMRDPAWHDTITFVQGDVLDPALPVRVAAALGTRARCLVVEDTAHVAATTRAALDGFARFVAPGGYLVVEDGVVDEPELRPAGAEGGVQPAIAAWLATAAGAEFTVRRDLERYGITTNVGGYLQRTGVR